MDTVTYKEAAEILDVSQNEIRQLTHRKLLMPLPRKGLYSELSKEQVLLFVGKEKFSLRLLTQEEYAKWESINAEIEDLKRKEVSIDGIDTTALAETVVSEALQMLSELFTQKKRLSQEERINLLVLLILSCVIVVGTLRAIAIVKSLFTSEDVNSAIETIKTGDIESIGNIINLNDVKTQKAIEDIKQLDIAM